MAAKLARGEPTAICLDCRTVLREGQRCDGGPGHRVVSTKSNEGRIDLHEAIWGPPPARERAAAAAKGGGIGCFALVALLELASDLITADLDLVTVAVVAGVTIFCAWMAWLYLAIRRRWEKAKNKLRPRGAGRKPAGLGQKTGLRGKIVGGATNIRAAGSEEPCRGYAIELESQNHVYSPIMLRHSHAAPLEIALDDGSLLTIPAGRLRIAAPETRIAADDAHVDDYLDVDLDGVVPYDTVVERRLHDGDAVEIHGELEREALEGTGGNAYRQSRWRYRPRGPMGLVVVDRKKAASG